MSNNNGCSSTNISTHQYIRLPSFLISINDNDGGGDFCPSSRLQASSLSSSDDRNRRLLSIVNAALQIIEADPIDDDTADRHHLYQHQ
jgi:hypothetical protein